MIDFREIYRYTCTDICVMYIYDTFSYKLYEIAMEWNTELEDQQQISWS